MQIEIRTDDNIEGSDGLIAWLSGEVDDSLARFRDRLTRVEVHLGDENAGKGGADDKRCMLEARPAGLQPVTVTHHAATVEEACKGALKKMQTLLGRQFGRLDDRKGNDTIRRADT